MQRVLKTRRKYTLFFRNNGKKYAYQLRTSKKRILILKFRPSNISKLRISLKISSII